MNSLWNPTLNEKSRIKQVYLYLIVVSDACTLPLSNIAVWVGSDRKISELCLIKRVFSFTP